MKLSDGTEWVLVPRVATEEMYDAAKAATWIGSAMADRCYRTMLAAAPQPPVEEMVEALARDLHLRFRPDPPFRCKLEWDDMIDEGRQKYRDHARAIVKRLIGSE